MNGQQKTSGLLPSAVLVLALALILIGERVFGEGGWRQAVSGAGSAAFVLALALRTRALLRAEGDMRRAEVRLLASKLGMGVALLLYALTTDWSIQLMGLQDPAISMLKGPGTVVWLVIATVSLLALLFMELAYARMPVARSVELRRVRVAAQAGVTLAFSVIFLLCVNYVAAERQVRRDVSYFKTTEPSATTLGLVRRLDQPLAIYLFYPRANEVLEQIRPYFAALAAASEHVKLKTVDFALVPELARKHRIGENGKVLLLHGEDKEQKGRSFAVGRDLMGARRTLRKLDGEFQTAFRKLTQAARTVYLTVGHGERNSRLEKSEPGDRAEGMKELLKRLNITTRDLGVGQGLASEVPTKASAIVIVGPSEKFMPEESKTLLAYVRNGGRLLMMLDPNRDLGLEPLLSGLGVELLDGTLASEKHHLRRRFGPSDHALVYSNSYTSHPSVTTANRHRQEVATVFANGGAIARRKAKEPSPKPKVNFPLRSAWDCWRDLDDDFIREQGENRQTLNMMAAVTISKKDHPEGRALIIADGDFISDKLVGNAGNALVFVDALGWLIADEHIGADATSEEDVAIEHTREQDKIWFYATSFAVPLPILGLGVWVARRRRRRPEAKS